MDLTNKNILIVCPFFFDYHKRIRAALEARGAHVDMVDEQPSHKALARVMMRKDIGLYHKTVERYFKKVMAGLKKDYDDILFIKCEAPTEQVLKQFKRRYPFARRILYLWDSVNNITHITSKFAYFDKIYSFDHEDVKKYSFLEYAYWGFTKEFDQPPEAEILYDVSFVGTLHSIRPAVLESVAEQCRVLGLSFYQFVYMPHPIVFWYNKLTNPYFRKVKKDEIHYRPLSTEQSIDIYRHSAAVLEIENINQSGATTRLGEMIGMRKKIITTYDCRKMDFYRKENQMVIDSNHVQLDPDFFASPYQPVDEAIRQKYSFESFIDTIFQ